MINESDFLFLEQGYTELEELTEEEHRLWIEVIRRGLVSHSYARKVVITLQQELETTKDNITFCRDLIKVGVVEPNIAPEGFEHEIIKDEEEQDNQTNESPATDDKDLHVSAQAVDDGGAEDGSQCEDGRDADNQSEDALGQQEDSKHPTL